MEYNCNHIGDRKSELNKASALTAYLEDHQVKLFKMATRELSISSHELIECWVKDWLLSVTGSLSKSLREEITHDDIISSYYADPPRVNPFRVDPAKQKFSKWLATCWEPDKTPVNPDNFL